MGGTRKKSTRARRRGSHTHAHRGARSNIKGVTTRSPLHITTTTPQIMSCGTEKRGKYEKRGERGEKKEEGTEPSEE
eukprot:EC799042.1.p4 GENE.EC799042.1~~EC799042.1.p4  ORF type:complete len:77 (-),score=0.98 EC799042.1:311-541(-)